MVNAEIFIIDANRLFRDGLKSLFANTGFGVVGESADPKAGAVAIERTMDRPDIVLVDPTGKDGDDMGAVAEMARLSRVVILSSDLCPRRLNHALAAGARGYLTKDIGPEALVQSLRLVIMGESVFPANLVEVLGPARRPGGRSHEDEKTGPLSRRERHVLSLLARGDSNKLIAANLEISEATVKAHLKNLLRKVGAANRTQAAVWALNNGMAGPEAEKEEFVRIQPSGA